MIGGQQESNHSHNNEKSCKVDEENANPQNLVEAMDVQPNVADNTVTKQDQEQHKNIFMSFRDIDKEVEEIVRESSSSLYQQREVPIQQPQQPQQVTPQPQQPIQQPYPNSSQQPHHPAPQPITLHPLTPEQQEPHPSPPIEQSLSQAQSQPSNPSKSQTRKPPPFSNELIQLTKKSTTTYRQRKQRQRKIPTYVTDFHPYLPPFMDQMHRQHHKTIIRIGASYQAPVATHPQFQTLYRPLNHLRIWRGTQQPFSQQAFKKFREIYGDTRTEEELILLKHRLHVESWGELVREMVGQRQVGKKPSIVVGSGGGVGVGTRNK